VTHLRDPDEVLTDNGKVFTGRFGKPRPAEVLFERICRKNGIRQLLTKPYSTTIGKVERWHQTLQTDFLTDAGPFTTVEDAQAAVDAWRREYNHDRPHQSLGMATPASRFRLSPAEVARQRIQVGMTHAGKIVTVAAETNSFRLVIDGETVGVVPRTTSHEIGRYKAYATHPGRR
jgi:hypothetical protein